MNYERFRFSTFCCRRCVISAAHAQIEFLTSFLKSAPLVYPTLASGRIFEYIFILPYHTAQCTTLKKLSHM